MRGLFKKNKHSSLLKDLKSKNLQKFESLNYFSKSSSFFKASFLKLFSRKTYEQEVIADQIEECLIALDFGPHLAGKFAEAISSKVKKGASAEDLKSFIFKELLDFYNFENFSTEINFQVGRTNVFFIVGANGSGKTTSIAKLANFYKLQGLKVLVIAADTFRAGAVAQLKAWSDHIGTDILAPERDKEDPASLIYKGLLKNQTYKYDLIICDTSGKQHNNKELLQELSKIHRTFKKFSEDFPHETILILDSSIGQSSLLQSKSFLEHAKVSSIFLTKMDSLTRGGIIFLVKDQLKIPVKLIGTGESLDDIAAFDLKILLDSWIFKNF